MGSHAARRERPRASGTRRRRRGGRDAAVTARSSTAGTSRSSSARRQSSPSGYTLRRGVRPAYARTRSTEASAGRCSTAVARSSSHRRGSDEILTGALAGYARALYFAGNLDDAWEVALRVIEHPDAERRAPSHALARATLALVAVERGWLESARGHAEKAKAVVGGIGTSRSWLGANASAALGAVLASEGKLVEAEHELAYAEHYFRDEVATVHHAWLLVLLARVRAQRGRLDEAEATLQAAREALAELADSGRLPSLADDVDGSSGPQRARADRGELLERPSKAELAVLRLLASDLSTGEIGEHLFRLPQHDPDPHTRALYRKLGANTRPEAVARATALGLLGQ